MRRFAISLWHFCAAMCVPAASFTAAISDPLHWLKVAGVVSADVNWDVPTIWRQVGLMLFGFGWLLVWFHRKRIAFEDSKPQEPTMPLFLACRWIARDSVWAEKYLPERDDEWVTRVDDELMAKVLQGRIELFGKRHQRGHPSGPMQHVLSEFISGAEWDSHKLSTSEPPTHMWHRNGDSYYNVCLDEARVKQLWPQRSVLARVLRRSPIERIGKGYSALFAQQDAYYRDKEPVLMSAFEQLFGRYRSGQSY